MMAIYPFGRCLVIRPPSQQTLDDFKPKYIYVNFNNTYVDQLKLSSVKVKIFLMDNINSPKLNPDDMEMVGDQIETRLEPKSLTYRTRISKSEHVTGDPLFDCTVYTIDNSYDDCIRSELKDLFQNEIACQPPNFANNRDEMCNQKFNVSDKKWEKINKMFQQIFYKDWDTGCLQNPMYKEQILNKIESYRTISVNKYHYCI